MSLKVPPVQYLVIVRGPPHLTLYVVPGIQTQSSYSRDKIFTDRAISQPPGECLFGDGFNAQEELYINGQLQQPQSRKTARTSVPGL